MVEAVEGHFQAVNVYKLSLVDFSVVFWRLLF